MAVYEYQCENCGLKEIEHSIKDDALEQCPECQGAVERLISKTSFSLKGSGWYETDYKRKR